MDITILTNCRRLKYRLHDLIFANTHFPIANTLLSAGARFFFRMLAAKLNARWDMSISQPRVSLIGYAGSFDTKNLARISFSSISTGNSPDGQRRGLSDVSADPAVRLELSQYMRRARACEM